MQRLPNGPKGKGIPGRGHHKRPGVGPGQSWRVIWGRRTRTGKWTPSPDKDEAARVQAWAAEPQPLGSL
jgi:hypothetical protein